MAEFSCKGEAWSKRNWLNMDKAKDAMQRALIEVIGDIQRNTSHGIDANGAPFADYSDKYKAHKFDRTITGRKRSAKTRAKYAAAAVVNLTRTGTMLKSMFATVETGVNGILGKIGFLPTSYIATKGRVTTADVARFNNEGTTRTQARKFFALSKKHLDLIFKAIKDALKQ